MLVQRAERAIMKANPPKSRTETGRGHKVVLRENDFIEPSLIRNIRHAHDGLSDQGDDKKTANVARSATLSA